MEARLIALEEQLMFLERHVQQLDEQVRSLANGLDAARTELAATRQLGESRFERVMEQLEQTRSDTAPERGGGGPHPAEQE